MMSRETKSSLIPFLLLLLIGVVRVQGDCKLHDAYWKKNLGPTITQPSRNDATKVQISWGKVIENARCVDEFVLQMWKTGTDERKGLRITGIPKSTRAKIIEVEPCVSYSFKVLIVERDWTHTDKKATNVATYETTAVPSMRSLDRSNFFVGYAYNRAQKMHDLSKAVVGINKRAVYNVNCLKEVRISGEVINDRQYDSKKAKKGVWAQRRLQRTTTTVENDEDQWRSGFLFRQRERRHWDEHHYDHHNSDNDHHRHGHGHGHGRGHGHWNQQNEDDSLRRRGRRQSSASSGGLRPNTGLDITLRPPFDNGSLISTELSIRACDPHRFRMKIIGPGNREVGDIRDLYLPLLRDLDDYRPPRLDDLFKVNNRGEVKVKDNMGVPQQCLEDFFKAMDKRLEASENAMLAMEDRVENAWQHADNVHQLLDDHKKAELSHFGCKCNSSYIFLNVTDEDQNQRFRDKLGVYMFRGMHQQKPYYVRVANESLWLRMRSHRDTTITSDGRREQRHRQEEQVHKTLDNYQDVQDDLEDHIIDWKRHHWPGFKSNGLYGNDQADHEHMAVVYWDRGSWVVAKHLSGDQKAFRLKKGIKCPGDEHQGRKWEYSGTLAWKNEPSLKWACNL